jgi:Zn-dependent protease with chaperone function
MNFPGFFNSYPGMYIAQSFLHSLIAAIITDRAIQLWNIGNPLIRQRFRLIVVLLPALLFPLYQIINPDRSSISFRLNSLFDINRWLSLELWGVIPLVWFFISIIFIATAIFLFQELIPILQHLFESKTSDFEFESSDDYPVVRQAIETLPGEKPEVFIFDDDEYVLFSTTGKNAAVFISTGIIKTLTVEQLQAAITHEIAHIIRNKRPLLIMVFLFRIIMFFNPVVLLEFRRITQEEEKICDDITVSLTNKPHALSETLKRLYHKDKNINLLQLGNLSEMKNSVEEYSHNIHIENRIVRLEKSSVQEPYGEWFNLMLTVIIITGICYFVV